MKTILILLLLPILIWMNSTQMVNAGSTNIPVFTPKNRPNLTMFKTFQSLEQKRIMQDAVTLLTNRDYAGLDALAAKYRVSKESYAEGVWKLVYVYNGLVPDRKSPESEWQSRLKLADDWISARTNSITAHVAKARLLTGYAWQARGGSWAYKVEENQWKRFFELLQQSNHALNKAGKLTERCPVYWSSLQHVALGLQAKREDYDAIFADAIKEFPDYPLYFAARAHYLLPRWNGTEGEWEHDLTLSADRIGGEKGDMLYAQTVWSMNHVSHGVVVFKGNRISLERLEKGFAELLKAYPDSLAAKSEIAYLALEALNKEKAHKYLAALNGQVDREIYGEIFRYLTWLYLE